MTQLEIRVRGRVQGVGFRPTVWRFARELGLAGEVWNDGQGVLIRAGGSAEALARFVARIEHEAPPLARIDRVETTPYVGALSPEFVIVASEGGTAQTQIAPDAAMCAACAAEVLDASERRSRYPFTTCTHCGPRLTIVTGVPYDRAATTMAPFALCAACHAQYVDPADRRFHAETTACDACGPRVRLIRLDGDAAVGEVAPHGDAIDAACALIADGAIVAIKGLGGYHLACDATRAEVVEQLRARKHRDAKPFALMARDVEMIRRYAAVSDVEAAALTSPEAPIVLLDAHAAGALAASRLPAATAPGVSTLGFMLPTTPRHLLVARRLDRPLVMTSGNISDEPQVTTDDDLARRLGGIATHALVHDRPIANRVDDSVVRVVLGKLCVLRRARGYAPAPIRLPAGFEIAPSVLAYGGDLKATFCMVQRGEAVLSQHQGDLDDLATFDDYAKHLALYTALLAHEPIALAIDLHPEFRAAHLARARGLPTIAVQHHHAHVAACLVDNGRPLEAPPVLGVVLDGLGLGGDGTIWGGEFLVADYRGYTRVGALAPIAMLGGDRASTEPWRNLYAHVTAALGWPAFAASFGELPSARLLAAKPRAALDQMMARGVNAPLASSCGRLFDAVAAAVGIAFDAQRYEGEAAMLLEAAVDPHELGAYPFALVTADADATRAIATLDPAPMWRALLADLARATPIGAIAARFHRGLARAIVDMVDHVRHTRGAIDTVALSGGCFQNRVLLEHCVAPPRRAA